VHGRFWTWVSERVSPRSEYWLSTQARGWWASTKARPCSSTPVERFPTRTSARLDSKIPFRKDHSTWWSALAVHHLDGQGKADLFRRVANVVVPGGRFVVGDVVVPEDPADAVTPIDGEYDKPSSAAEQLRWLCEAGFRAHVAWAEADVAVLVGDLSPT
jgi:hypothetical protein